MLASCVLAQAPLSLAAQFEPDPAAQYVDARLSAAYLQAVVPTVDFTSVDSVVTFSLDDDGAFVRTGAAVFTVTSEAVLIEQDVTDLAGTRVTQSVSAQRDDPTDGELNIQQIVRETENGRTDQATYFQTGQFAGGRLMSSEIVSPAGFVSFTDRTRYGYNAAGLVATEVTATVTGGVSFPEDSTVVSYDDAGRPDVATTFSWDDDGTDAGYGEGQTLTHEYIDEGHFRARATDAESGLASVFDYHYDSGVLDSFFLRMEGSSDILLGIFRSDGGGVPGVVTYDYQLSPFGGGEPDERATYYFDGAVSGAGSTPAVTGAIAGANPSRVGASYRLEGAATPAGATWRLTDLAGRVISRGEDARQEWTMPAVASGIYLLAVEAPGYAPLSRAVVVE